MISENQNKLSRDQYNTILKDAFSKITKTVPKKKYKELLEVCKAATEQLDKDTDQKADKYFYILKMALETGLPRLMEHILVTIYKLYTYDCLIGDADDNCVYQESRKPPAKNGRLPRLLIDAIIDSIIECAFDADSQVQLRVINLLLNIVVAVNSKVKELTLLSAMRTQYSIFMSTPNPVNQNAAKAAITQMINTVFQRMDAYQRHGTNSSYLDLRKVESKMSATLEKSLQKKNEESKDSVSNNSQGRPSQPVEVAFEPLQLYVKAVVSNMVDNVCLYEARRQEITRQHTSDDQAELKEKLAKVPQNPIPSGKKDCPDVNLTNELGFEVGRFGWCISCRNAANLWCKDTKHPVCSEECKKKHFYEACSIEKQPEGTPVFSRSKEATQALIDAHLIFRSIVKLAVGDQNLNQKQLNHYEHKTRVLGLELIHSVLQNPKQALTTKKEFIELIKVSLCDGLLRFSVSTEVEIFKNVIEIFYSLFLHFRQHLKQIIRVFIETIFLKLLDSSNSSFQHKKLILGVFDRISRNTSMLLEIFVNYDCEISQKDLTERIIESLCKIANGKFAKTEHQNLISPQEAIQLRNYATLIIVQITRSFNATLDAKIAHEAITQRLSHAKQTDDDLEVQSVSEDTKKDKLDDIQNQRDLKTELSKAAKKFNFKDKNGIKYLVAQQMIAPESDYDQHVIDIVKFLKNTPVLDKTQIGVFLGNESKLSKACLYRFIDEFDLRNVSYVQSLKTILQGFRLPGEGQVVDRVMEKFGLKFIEDNPTGSDGCQGVMTAECVYLLSYATMMMQTSLHNPNAVKSRMTLIDFEKMIKGINAGQNLEPEFIKKIYETVEKEPFTLNEDDDARFKQEAVNATTFKRKQELFQKESASILERGQCEIKGTDTMPYIFVDDCGPIRPMFENTWSANLATLSMILEETTDETISNLCIEGFILSIKICGFFNMRTERDAFVSSFAKFTLVTSERRIKPKNISCIKSLINLATHQGNYLGESWYFVLECVSRLEEMINIAEGQAQDRDFFDEHRPPSKSVSSSASKQQQSQANTLANAELILQTISLEQIERIFQNSLNLDTDAIIHFIDSLCRNSKVELRDQNNPRKFSLQALVEVADLNMTRIRFVWSKIWELLSEHFIWVGSHTNLMVAIFDIDSLRQLADKFLKREEFMSFNFQKDFLKPFEQIMLNNMHTRSEIKDYIVTCITNICATKTIYIKSGWSVIINIFTLAAQDTEPQLVLQSFEALKQAINKHFDLLKNNFVELINCLNKYSLNTVSLNQAAQAQDYMLVCAEQLQDQSLIDYFVKEQGLLFHKENQDNISRYPPQYGISHSQQQKQIAGSIPQTEDKDQPSDSQVKLATLKGLWFPLLQNVSNLVIDKNPDSTQQERAMKNLFSILERATFQNTYSFWREVFSQVMYPVLEDIQLAIETYQSEQDQQFYLQTLQQIVEKFALFLNEFYKQLPDVVSVYIDIICQFIADIKDKQLAQVISTSLSNLIKTIGDKLSPKEWDSFTSSLCLCFEATLPKDLLSEDVGSLDHQFTRTVIQVKLIDCVRDTFAKYSDQFTYSNIRQILQCLEVSHQFAQKFNENVEVRQALRKQGFMRDIQQTLPGLLTQEYKALATIIQIRFSCLFKKQDDDHDELLQLVTRVLNEYQLKTRELLSVKKSNLTRESQDQESDVHCEELEKQVLNLTPIISNILSNLYRLDDVTLRKRIKELSQVAIELTLCPDQEVRTQNRDLLGRMFEMLV